MVEAHPCRLTAWTTEGVERSQARDARDWGFEGLPLVVVLKEHQAKAAQLSENCQSFGMPSPRFEGMAVIAADIEGTASSWSLLKDYSTEVKTLTDQDWISFRANVYALQDFATAWGEKVRARMAEAQRSDAVTERLLQELEKIKRVMPCLKHCRGEPFKEEHWGALLQGKLGLDRSVRLENLTLGHFITGPALDKLADASLVQFVKHLQARAQGEVTIREALQELVAWSQTSELKLTAHERDGGRATALIRDWKELFLELGDKQSLLASLKESQFFKAFQDTGATYELKLALLDQRRWVYLEPIFGRGALPAEAARFRRVDEDFRDIMAKVAADPKLFSLADEHLFPGLATTLSASLDQLERCQKALADFLEQKRSALPRFYFIGDDDLLEILGQARNPAVIQEHLKKLFQGIHRVEFNEDHTQIVAMLSSAGEVVRLESPVKVGDKVEEWLEKLNAEMKNTLSSLLLDCLKGPADYDKYPSQVLCIAEQVKFCSHIEAAMGRDGVGSLMGPLRALLDQYTSFDLSAQPLLQLKIKALVLDLVHSMDVVRQLEQAGTRNQLDWAWQKQESVSCYLKLRYYVEANGKCVVRMGGAQFDYTHEYQGNAPKLVHTPLTDRCYLTLTQGMHMGFGGNPYGPAGTGKTESVKALGQAFGRQVLVFNCDEGIDFQSMGRILIGLTKCGAWGCFDEFNRLKEDQLSAVSQQIQVIQDAIKARQPTLRLLGRAVDVDFNAGIFVTLNPAGKDYGGRSRLPDNLKALFRPVAMGRPDNEMIAEVILYSEGFGDAKELSAKIVSLFSLARQLLSRQQHYDWGLRALKAVLNTGGKLIQSMKRDGSEVSEAGERELLIKAVRVNTLSKLTYADTRLFLALIGDVFPGVTSADMSGGELEAAIREVMAAKPWLLEVDDAQIRKMLQLKESLDQRMGCVIVGPSGCGKSAVWGVLKAAMAVVTHVMNPKSMPRQRLLGRMDLDTREWTDGVLTEAARRAVREPPDVRTWIVCDGDVDPEWIESLNSVLDDNRLLTLPNGERISFGPNVNFLFETHDLRFASPATVSRMGMIFLSDEDVEVRRLVDRWLRTQDEGVRTSLAVWVTDLFYKALSYVLDQEMVVDTTMVGTVLSGLSQVTGASSKAEFICGLVRGLGGNLSLADRTAFAKEVFQWAGERPPDPNSPLDCYADRSGSLCQFIAQREAVGSGDGTSDAAAALSSVVPTVSVQRTLAAMEPWMDSGEPFILVGPEGCGKDMIIRHSFGRRGRKVSLAVLHCNAQTTAEDVIAKVAQTCSLFSSPEGRVYRPRDSERLVLYLKDINLPRPDMYDTCMLVAFLQQLLTFGGFYDEGREFLRVERVQLVASMNAATTVGRHPLSTRFTASVRILVCDYPDAAELSAVYDALLSTAFAAVPGMDTKSQQEARFSVDDQRHYLFTPRDLTAWCSGLLRYDLQGGEELLDCLAYEAQRLFRDRLVDVEAESRFDGIIATALRTHWRYTPVLTDMFFSTLGQGVRHAAGGDAVVASHPLLRTPAAALKSAAQQGLMYYEREERDLLFADALAHLARCDRVLSAAGGHLLLVGRSGVGRRQAGYTMSTPVVTRDGGLAQFRLDLRAAMQTAGIEGTPVVFYVEDHQITTDAVLETLNSLLSAGEAPGLYTPEELEPLLAPLREKMLEEGKTLAEFFVSRVQRFLHVALALDPTHPQFVIRCESNPALYTRCQCLWFGDWRRNVMTEVPRLLEGVKELLGGGDEGEGKGGDGDGGEEKHGGGGGGGDGGDAARLLDVAVGIHQSSAEAFSATPLEFLAFLRAWHALHAGRRDGLRKGVADLRAGLGKLSEAAETVDALSQSAAKKQRELQSAQVAADSAMEQITTALSEATVRRGEVEVLKKELAASEQQTKARKADIEQELSSIQPVLDSAKQAVGQIKSDNLNEIRSLKMPPEPIADVLGRRGVKEDILNYDAHRMSPELRAQVSKLLKQKEASFEQSNIYRVSVAAAPLAAWVKANVRYSIVLEKIQPLEEQLSEAVGALDKAQARLTECEDELAGLDGRVRALKEEFGARTREAETLRAGLEKAQATLDKAQSLLGQLGGEQERWKCQAKSLSLELRTLPLHTLLCAGFAAYLPRASESVRSAMVARWCDLAGVQDDTVDSGAASGFNFKRRMSTESQLLVWKGEGLPADDLSQENALALAACLQGDMGAVARVPFVIDPASAATAWLRAFLSKDAQRPLEVVSSGDPRFSSSVELAVRFGKTLLILEADGLEPMLYPLARRDLQHQGPRWVVQVGDRSVDYNEGFRMVLVTRRPAPDLPPCAAALLAEVNFTVTRSGLEGQLLGATIQHEQPELEKAKSDMLAKEEAFKASL
ncbi:dynein heavy chain, N-terminal region 2-domain-containing protein [Tribonema minus]|uniref:Dynein heavy chain, N-terminal region 2-domain-containing protein n=1 Tax=Tribonema minus TaxID=303371 RepID=A0A836CKQ4_9STRA|nr:dynein heavy chain, N-terminal region 2-domain-containing protein [Tribonema minus]